MMFIFKGGFKFQLRKFILLWKGIDVRYVQGLVVTPELKV